MRLYLQQKTFALTLEIDAATLTTLAQVLIWLIGKYLGWF